MDKNSEILTLKQACALLNCHPNTLRKWSDKGKVHVIRFGKRGDRRFRKSDLLKILEKSTQTEEKKSYYESENEVMIPLRGTASCGNPTFYADDNIEDYISLDRSYIREKRSKYFFVRASGSSMSKAGIFDSSLALVHQKDSYQDGEDVLAVIDGKACIKRLYKGDSALMLMPVSHDESHEPIIVSDDIYVAGKVVCSIPAPTSTEELQYIPILQ